jgi:hypothetical protein
VLSTRRLHDWSMGERVLAGEEERRPFDYAHALQARVWWVSAARLGLVQAPLLAAS